MNSFSRSRISLVRYVFNNFTHRLKSSSPSAEQSRSYLSAWLGEVKQKTVPTTSIDTNSISSFKEFRANVCVTCVDVNWGLPISILESHLMQATSNMKLIYLIDITAANESIPDREIERLFISVKVSDCCHVCNVCQSFYSTFDMILL
jgi:hypothetical protein